MADEKKDSLAELFEGISSDILTDEVQLKVATLFESAVNEAIKAKEMELEESNKVEIAEFKEDLVGQVDSYLEYFCKDYIKENEGMVEDFSKVRLAEKILRNFKQMAEAFNLSLSDDSISSEDEMAELTAENTDLVNKLIESRKEIQLIKKTVLVSESCEKLATDIQREKLVELAKTVEFDEMFESKLEVLIAKILAEKEEVKEEKLVEKKEDVKDEKKAPSETMQKYLKHI